MLEFAHQGRDPDRSRDAVRHMRRAGFSDREMLEIVVVAGLFHDYNYRVSRLGLELEDWFVDRRA